MFTKPYEVQVVRTAGELTSLRNSRALIYWPHGFGDFVFLSYIVPLLDRSNRFFVGRFADDNTSLFDNCPLAAPLYIGCNATEVIDDKFFDRQHMGLRDLNFGRGVCQLQMPLGLAVACDRAAIDTVVDIPFGETYGRMEPPFHTKARFVLSEAVGEGTFDATQLSQPLKACIEWCAPESISAWVEARLRSVCGFGPRRLCLVARNGFTSVGKNWGHRWREEMPSGKQREGEEARDFMRLMLREDEGWMFLAIEDRLFDGDDTLRDDALNCWSYAELFGETRHGALPFGFAMKVLTNLAELAVGVPAGPYHLAMAKPGLPVVGIWTEHLPSWYDEPKAESIHLVSRNLRETGADQRPGSIEREGAFHFDLQWMDGLVVPGQAAFDAAYSLLSGTTHRLGSVPLTQANGARVETHNGVHEKVPTLSPARRQSLGTRLDLKTVTLVCYETEDHAAALDLMAAMCRLADFGGAKLLNHFRGWEQFNYWENYETWRYITTSHALIVHLDGYIVHPELWDSAWLEYDYIGAPWPESLNKDRVGNGGFCLKSRRLMNRVAELPWVALPGDVMVCSHYRSALEREGFRFAPVSVAAQFSIEHKVPESVPRTFGFHADWNYPRWKLRAESSGESVVAEDLRFNQRERIAP